MDDLELTKRCAQAMGLPYRLLGDSVEFRVPHPRGFIAFKPYDPLTDDAQCFALVKHCHLVIHPPEGEREFWEVYAPEGKDYYEIDLNRAICECVAKLPSEPPHG